MVPAQKQRWYVIQVQSGREQTMCKRIERVCREADLTRPEGDRLVEEVFTPRYRTRVKYRGEWQDAIKLLLPGYVIAVTVHPEELHEHLRQMSDFTRLLSMGESFVPLRDDECEWIDEWTTKGDRVVEMSLAVASGDSWVIRKGPLMGREGMIVKVNRHKCLAVIEMHVGQMRVHTPVGLAIVPEGSEVA